MRRRSMPRGLHPKGCVQEVEPYNIRTTMMPPGAVELRNIVTDPQAAERIRNFCAGVPAESFARASTFAMSQAEEVDVNEILFRSTR